MLNYAKDIFSPFPKLGKKFYAFIPTLKKWRTTIFIVFGLILMAWMGRHQIMDLMYFISDREAFSIYISNFGLLGPVVLALFQFLQVIVAIMPGYPLFIATGYIYGLPIGFLFNLLSTVAASLLAFGIARRFGRPVVNRLTKSEVLDRWDLAADRYGFPFFLMSFLLPIFPADTMNYAGGLSAISWKKFILARLLGSAPSLFMLTMLGSHGTELSSWGIPIWGWVLIVLLLGAIYYLWQYYFGASITGFSNETYTQNTKAAGAATEKK